MRKKTLQWQYLLAVLKGDTTPPVELDVHDFLRLLNVHRLAPWFYTQVVQAQPEVFMQAPELVNVLKQHFKQHKLKTLAQLAARVQICQAFEKQGIEVINIKGEVLSQQLYGDPFVRQSKDIDILIAPEKILEADRVMIKLGYKRQSVSEQVLREKTALLQKASKDLVYLHPKTKQMVEVHWRLLEQENRFRINFEKLLEGSHWVVIQGNSFRVMEPMLNALYVCCHGAKHGFARLTWAVDGQCSLDGLRRAPQPVWPRAKKLGVNRMLSIAQKILTPFFGRGKTISFDPAMIVVKFLNRKLWVEQGRSLVLGRVRAYIYYPLLQPSPWAMFILPFQVAWGAHLMRKLTGRRVMLR